MFSLYLKIQMAYKCNMLLSMHYYSFHIFRSHLITASRYCFVIWYILFLFDALDGCGCILICFLEGCFCLNCIIYELFSLDVIVFIYIWYSRTIFSTKYNLSIYAYIIPDKLICKIYSSKSRVRLIQRRQFFISRFMT